MAGVHVPAPTPVVSSEKPRPLERAAPVRWFNYKQLARTGVKTVLSSLFGAYSDKRELFETKRKVLYDYSSIPSAERVFDSTTAPADQARDEIWIDYLADLGDGWNATYTMALLLAQEELQVGDLRLPRGQVLIMGGDQVYPTATRQEYYRRLVDPYRAARPVKDPQSPTDLYVIPGNHDWYDGLTSFTRLFCRGRSLGGWSTRQERSYFALRLPHRWWLFGLDIQLESDIDQPQLNYFERIIDLMEPDDRVILCNAEPIWVFENREKDGGPPNLPYLESKILAKCTAGVSLMVAGDSHHYCHFENKERHQHRITSGGGGAFLHETHNLPKTIKLKTTKHGVPGSDETLQYERTTVFPDVSDSRRLMLRNIFFPWWNLDFTFFLGAFYLIFAWILQSSSKMLASPRVFCGVGSLIDSLVGCPLVIDNSPPILTTGGDSQVIFTLRRFLEVFKHSPGASVLALGLVAAMIYFVEPNKRHSPMAQGVLRLVLGSLHGAVHLALLIFLITAAAHLNRTWLEMMETERIAYVVVFTLELGVFGGLLGSILFGGYLLWGNLLFGVHSNAASSALRGQDRKNFLRMHIGRDGSLTIYPIGVRKIFPFGFFKRLFDKGWVFHPSAEGPEPWYTPETEKVQEAAHLIDGKEIRLVAKGPPEQRAQPS